MDIEKIKKFFLEHPATLFTVVFLFSSATGIFYDFIFYNSFHLNILDYSKAEDSLLSWLRDRNMIFGALFIFLFYFATYLTHYLVNTERSLNKSSEVILKRKNHSLIGFILIALLILVHSFFWAKLYPYSFSTTCLLFIMLKILDLRVAIFNSKLRGRAICIRNGHTVLVFIFTWIVVVYFTALSTAQYVKNSKLEYYSIELKDTVLKSVKMIGKNSSYSFISLSGDSTIKIINNEEILSYTKRMK